MTNAQAIRQLAQLRARNNRHWMALVALAFRVAPNEAKTIFRQIAEGDRQIQRVARRLTK